MIIFACQFVLKFVFQWSEYSVKTIYLIGPYLKKEKKTCF